MKESQSKGQISVRRGGVHQGASACPQSDQRCAGRADASKAGKRIVKHLSVHERAELLPRHHGEHCPSAFFSKRSAAMRR